MTIDELLDLPKGSVLQKGNRKRIYLGFTGMGIAYTTPSKPNKVTVEFGYRFLKWSEGAETVERK